ncbi:MAG TPA: hypothetical protein DCW90_05920 [Lachnospiraceae bacterium]|nr:hypothetical protein [Lachnospiraceae bacterium]
MYFKILFNDRLIDLLENPLYVKYQKANDVFLVCSLAEAEGVISSDGNTIWHVDTFPSMDTDIDSVTMERIDKYQFDQLKMLNMKTPEEIIDSYTLSLLEGGLL